MKRLLPLLTPFILAVIVITTVVVINLAASPLEGFLSDVLGTLSTIGLAASMSGGMNLADAQLSISKSLPAAAGSVTSGSIDLKNSSRGDFLARCELLLTAPALTVTQLPNGVTMTYKLVMADSADLATNQVTIVPSAIIQTGAGGAGTNGAASTYRFKPPTTTQRYIGFIATGAATLGDCSGVSGTLALLV